MAEDRYKAVADIMASIFADLDRTLHSVESMRGSIERLEAYMLALVLLMYGIAIFAGIGFGILLLSRRKKRNRRLSRVKKQSSNVNYHTINVYHDADTIKADQLGGKKLSEPTLVTQRSDWTDCCD